MSFFFKSIKKAYLKQKQLIHKKTYLGAILGTFFPNFGKNEFSWKKVLSVFVYSNYLPSWKKSDKTNEPILIKILNWQTDGQTDKQGWFNKSKDSGPTNVTKGKFLRGERPICFTNIIRFTRFNKRYLPVGTWPWS